MRMAAEKPDKREERGTGNGERGTGNGEERGTGNGERGTGNGERGTGNGERGTGKCSLSPMVHWGLLRLPLSWIKLEGT